jgi:ABC-2 type transport system ATP-binding protein
LCQRAVIINHGAVVLNESMKNLKYNYLNQKLIDVKFKEPVAVNLPGIVKLKEKEDVKGTSLAYAAKIEVDTKRQNLQQIVGQIFSLGEVADITISDQPLEEIIAAIYTGTKD